MSLDYLIDRLIRYTGSIAEFVALLLLFIAAVLLRKHEKNTATFLMLVGASLNALRCLEVITFALRREGIYNIPYDFLMTLSIVSFTYFGQLMFTIGLMMYVFQRQQMKARIRELEQMVDDLHQR